MQHALGLTAQQHLMFSIMLALGIAGILALFMAIFWPPRWRLPYSAEVIFAGIITALGVYGALDSQATVSEYEANIPRAGAMSGPVASETGAGVFDQAVSAYLYQWGFIFIDARGTASRNALEAKPGERVLVRVLSNDVIHGFQIPAAHLTTEVDPEAVRSVWFRAPDKPGKYLIQCIDYCGIGHYQMKAWLVVTKADGDRPEGRGTGHG